MDQPSNNGNGRNFSEVGSFFSLAKEKKDLGGVFEARIERGEKTSRGRGRAENNMESTKEARPAGRK